MASNKGDVVFASLPLGSTLGGFVVVEAGILLESSTVCPIPCGRASELPCLWGSEESFSTIEAQLAVL
jgi:hypothetical protein